MTAASWLAAIDQLCPEVSEVKSASPVGGGCISDAMRIEVKQQDGSHRVLFAKSNEASFLENFESEADGLRRLAQVDAIVVPEPVAVGMAGPTAVLILDWIETGRQSQDFFDAFGRQLATQHRRTLRRETTEAAIGLDRDNYLGAARQINSPTTDWPSFVAEHRIGFQLRWAVDQGRASGQLQQDVQQIIDRIESLLAGREDQSSLLHGDLWSGNYLSDQQQRPVIIDPAVYHGCREAEFGMLKLFGSCPVEFYDAYQNEFPMPEGWQRRVDVYVLYHLLNHLNLFGSGYRGQCESIARRILS